ncbi:sulfite exporter TauE/SafE family protein [Paucilactobacillus suebicus]|uniref:Probable membrane transporter protein n=1 Tax=Paucilactobacillus suebicus DSM 5007 = KCTC 3549 TaxID=1423807 RepID=A0A0R1W401_9LACO|nr:sulfite exporter TauE/SafE family protein [Paucilactobacillus suebicus]KRM12274.1 permease [Paucilactobacillus suebicus DSM 5007 = KCTC 3549]
MTIVSLIVIGFVVGMFTISMGGGGAAIYLGVLTALFHVSPAVAASTSLMTAFPSLVVGSLSYFHSKKINFKIANQMLIAALPAVVVGSFLAPHIPNNFYKWLIGLILIILGIQIFVQRNKKETNQPNRLKASGFGVLSGLMVGIAGLSGGGPIVAGLLLMGLDMFDAAATSSYVLVGMTLVGIIFHLGSGQVDWSIGWGLMVGALIGALLAPRLMDRLSHSKNNKWLKPFMGVLLMLMGIKTII